MKLQFFESAIFIEKDLERGLPVEQIREWVYKEYDSWIIEEVIRDIGCAWLINSLADPPILSA